MPKGADCEGVFFVRIARCPVDGKTKDLNFGRESGYMPGVSKEFGTMRIFFNEDSAKRYARSCLEREMSALVKRGLRTRCAPKTIDDEHHNWRVIARVGAKDRPSLCVQAVVDYLNGAEFDPWIW